MRNYRSHLPFASGIPKNAIWLTPVWASLAGCPCTHWATRNVGPLSGASNPIVPFVTERQRASLLGMACQMGGGTVRLPRIDDILG